MFVCLAILGFHSMMNQDQYHASLLNSGQPVGLGWDGITKASQPKVFPMDPPNDTDVDQSIKQVQNNDINLIDLNLNNIKVSIFIIAFSFILNLIICDNNWSRRIVVEKFKLLVY